MAAAWAAPLEPVADHTGLRLVGRRAARRARAGAPAIPPIRAIAAGAARCWSSASRRTAARLVLVDTSPDLREQLIDAGVGSSRRRADDPSSTPTTPTASTICGRSSSRRASGSTSIWTRRPRGSMRSRFAYIFETPPGSSYPPMRQREAARRRASLASIEGPGGADRGDAVRARARRHPRARLSLRRPRLYARSQRHSARRACAFSKASTSGSSTRCATARIPRTFSLDEALAWIERLRPRRAILTNLHTDLDYETLEPPPAGRRRAGL